MATVTVPYSLLSTEGRKHTLHIGIHVLNVLCIFRGADIFNTASMQVRILGQGPRAFMYITCVFVAAHE